MNDYYYSSAFPGESRGGPPLSNTLEQDLPIICLNLLFLIQYNFIASGY